ncbi:MAG: S8 family serine peptidase [Pseudomonadota bacterium]
MCILRSLFLCLIATFVVLHPAQAQFAGGANDPAISVVTGGGDGPDDPARRTDWVIARSGEAEVMVLAPTAEAQSAADALVTSGARLLRQRSYPALGRTGLFFTVGARLTLQSAQRVLQQAAPGAVASVHVIYRFAQGTPRIYAAEMVGVTPQHNCAFGGDVTIGLIDGPVNPSHPALSGVRLTIDTVLGVEDRGVGSDHGTAVAALIAGRSGALSGVASGARLHAVTAFTRTGRGDGASTERVVAALDLLVGQGVRFINMSFAGRQNAVLDEALGLAAARGVTMIAAAGNDGTDIAAYPAASPHVIAVTAIDQQMRLYRAANTGQHIEFAAPGVDVFVASGAGAGGAYRSGTSYAAPIVTGLAARLGDGASIALVREWLRASTTDLGEPGRDQRYGWGLVQAVC